MVLSRCELVFENCFVPEGNVLGQEGKGLVMIHSHGYFLLNEIIWVIEMQCYEYKNLTVHVCLSNLYIRASGEKSVFQKYNFLQNFNGVI